MKLLLSSSLQIARLQFSPKTRCRNCCMNSMINWWVVERVGNQTTITRRIRTTQQATSSCVNRLTASTNPTLNDNIGWKVRRHAVVSSPNYTRYYVQKRVVPAQRITVKKDKLGSCQCTVGTAGQAPLTNVCISGWGTGSYNGRSRRLGSGVVVPKRTNTQFFSVAAKSKRLKNSYKSTAKFSICKEADDKENVA